MKSQIWTSSVMLWAMTLSLVGVIVVWAIGSAGVAHGQVERTSGSEESDCVQSALTKPSTVRARIYAPGQLGNQLTVISTQQRPLEECEGIQRVIKARVEEKVGGKLRHITPLLGLTNESSSTRGGASSHADSPNRLYECKPGPGVGLVQALVRIEAKEAATQKLLGSAVFRYPVSVYLNNGRGC